MKRQFSIYTKNESNDELELIGYIFYDIHADIFDSLLQESKNDSTKTFYIRHTSFEPYEVHIKEDDLIIFESLLVPVREPDEPNPEYMVDYIMAKGEEYVYSICMEEPSELIQAISKCKRSMELNGNLTEKVIWNFAEELADTLAIFEYVKVLYLIDDSIVKNYEDHYSERKERDQDAMIRDCINSLTKFISYLATYPYYKNRKNPSNAVITYEIISFVRHKVMEMATLFGIKESYIKYWIQFKQNRGRDSIPTNPLEFKHFRYSDHLLKNLEKKE